MQDLHFVSEDYEKRKSKDYRLSISIRRDGFSFLLSSKRAIVAYSYITVPENQRNTAFKEFLSQEILQDTFSAVSIIIVTPSFTCVPKKLYDDSRSVLEKMTKNEFLAELQDVLQTEKDLTLETILEDLEEWDSLSIL